MMKNFKEPFQGSKSGGIMAYSLRKVSQTAVVCCILHNLVLTTNLKDENLAKFGVLLVI